jgi:hypothetical protein
MCCDQQSASLALAKVAEVACSIPPGGRTLGAPLLIAPRTRVGPCVAPVRYSLSLFRAHLGLLSCSCTLAIERWADLEEVESAEPSGLAYLRACAIMVRCGLRRHTCVLAGVLVCCLPVCARASL